MRQWSCNCGNRIAFGSDSPRPCTVCDKCGTTLLRTINDKNEVVFVEPTEHEWKKRFSSETGEFLYEYCKNCFMERK